MYLSWEDGEKYMLDHKAVHKAPRWRHWRVERYDRMAELERDVLYKDSDFEIDSDDEVAFEQSELPFQSNTNEPTTVESVVGAQFHSTKKQLNKSERKRLVDLLRKTEVNAHFTSNTTQ